ncbi:sigma-54-dependent transcriptional regulator FlbD [Oceanibaculum indicum]|uniref:DNA-binding NtrC family response regulator n=1 Tax=Oceanibaculum indicum TaxID=526216 RepID=A0A420WRZ2_9PROT|nr:sigma-54 dependent transcriptional regulator [Oceanibaculum indicum]RKQ73827.1 DNA-binding NtrC family response regulator [Oceanibaculum indicum]
MRLLILGALEGHLTAASQIALTRGAKVSHADTIDKGLQALRAGQGADLVMIDVRLPIARFMESLKTERITIPVVACGIGTDADTAVRAIKAGAKEYVPLPPDAALIAAVLEAVAEESNAVIFKDVAMAQVIKLAEQIAPSDASVLITGESGTGKEVMARYLHSKSRRADQKFVALNCAAIPENLLESELFGHEKGAFTGAVARRIGKFEEANGGTLLLDEISEMDPRLQAKLLRVIQEREIDRVGGTTPVKVNVRLIATSNRNLEEEVKNGNFREDLYFRLNVFNLALPALRKRPQDIHVLAEHFVKKYSEANGIDIRPLSAKAIARLQGHHWKGNVRELENTLHRAVLLASGTEIGPEAIMLTGEQPGTAPVAEVPSFQAATDDGDDDTRSTVEALGLGKLVGRTVADVERDLIIDTLKHCLGNRTHAANILGISIRTLRNKLRQYTEEGVPVPMPGEAETA